MKVTVASKYFDKVLKKEMQPGDEIDVPETRAGVLLEAGVIEKTKLMKRQSKESKDE